MSQNKQNPPLISFYLRKHLHKGGDGYSGYSVWCATLKLPAQEAAKQAPTTSSSASS